MVADVGVQSQEKQMSFSEAIKLKVKHLAAFRCCRCESIGIEAHHIIPQENGGPDTLDNAAPLCPTCHSLLGANPEKRKEIKQMRDWWYTVVERKYGPTAPDLKLVEDKLNTLVSMVSSQQRVPSNAKDVLIEYLQNTTLEIEHIKPIANALAHSQFHGGSPCQMSGQKCPACHIGIVDVTPGEEGVTCNNCGLFIPAG